MVPNKFNIVDFGGFDLVEQSGETLPGIYDKIVQAHWNCVYIMCFGLKFSGVDIAPQYMTPEIRDDVIVLNGNISIDRDDTITVNLDPGPIPEPVIEPLYATENGVYMVPEGVDGFNPVEVEVEAPVSIDFVSTATGDSLTGWYSTRTITRVLESGPKLIALPFRANSGYTCLAFYTLRNLDVSAVISGTYSSYLTITGMAFPDSSVHDIFVYGAFTGMGTNPAYLYFIKSNGFGTCGSMFRGNIIGTNYMYGPTDEANGGNSFNAMSDELKDIVLNAILSTI